MNFRKLILLVLCIAFASPSTIGQSQERGANVDLAAKVDKVFEAFDKPTSPGCAVSVMKDGHIVYKHGYGMADLDHGIPITPSSVFHVASVSKQFTATAIVLLAQEGKLSLDDDVRKYIPEFPDLGERITIRHLLHHTSGVRDQWELLGLAGWRYSHDLITDDDVMELVARQKGLNFRPGDQHMYCNTGYTLLAQIVKRVSGKSLREFTTERIFKPLGMTNTHFRDNFEEIVKNQAYGYTPHDKTFELSVTNFDTVGATSLLTTVEDLALWDENFFDPKVGGKALIQQLQQRGVLNSGKEIDYALGLVISKYRGLPTVDHSGSDAGYRADIIRFPEQHFSVASTCNVSNSAPSTLTQKVADIYLADKLGPAQDQKPFAFTPITLTDQELSSYVGTYTNTDEDSFTHITRKPDHSAVLLMNGKEEFRPADKEHFYSATTSSSLAFGAIKSGAPSTLTLKDRSPEPKMLTRLTEFAPTADQMKEYAGDFQSEEIDPIYRIAVENGKLTLHRSKSGPATLTPRTIDLFQGIKGTIRFVRNDKHQVTGFVYNGSRLKKMVFKRKVG